MQSVLDNPRQVARIDTQNMLSAIYHFADPFLEPPRFSAAGVVRPEAINGLVLVGMGGSASAGDVLLDWLRDEIESYALVSREAQIPKFADANTLVVCFSYSGETWETLRAFENAWKRDCCMAAVGSGGRLRKICREKGVPFFRVDPGQPPRAALGQMVVAGSNALEQLRTVSGVRQRLLLAGNELAEMREKLRPSVPSSNNRAKKLAFLLKDRRPVIYGFQRMSSVPRRFKNQLAENSKVMAKYDLLPEGGHNEVESWRSADRSYIPVIIRDSRESREEDALVGAFKSTIVRAGKIQPLEIRIPAKSELGRLLAPILFLDYVSAYLALIRNVDPSPTLAIQEYKQKTLIPRRAPT